MPLPPYIRRDDGDPRSALDRERYQTVYARVPARWRAPTAGLHFTPELLASLRARGVETAFVTLHVGLGTFSPCASTDVEAHRMHDEAFAIPEATAEAVRERARARRSRRRRGHDGRARARIARRTTAAACRAGFADDRPCSSILASGFAWWTPS